MRTFLWLLPVSILFMLVAAGLNISNQGLNDLTMNNPGYVFAVHLGDGQVQVEALGQIYPCTAESMRDIQAHLNKLTLRITIAGKVVLHEGQVHLNRVLAWLQERSGEILHEWAGP